MQDRLKKAVEGLNQEERATPIGQPVFRRPEEMTPAQRLRLNAKLHGKRGFVEGLTGENIVPVWRGVQASFDEGRFAHLGRRVSDGKATQDEFDEYLDLKLSREQERTFGGMVGEGLNSLAGFGLEMAATRGLGSGVRTAVAGGNSASLLRRAAATTLGAAAQVAALEGASTALGVALADEPGEVPGGWVRAQMERLAGPEFSITPDAERGFALTLEKAREPLLSKFPEASLNAIFEMAFEQSGGAIGAAMEKIPLGAKVRALEADFFNWMRGTGRATSFDDLAEKLSKRTAIDRFTEEYAEEKLTDLASAMIPGGEQELGDVFGSLKEELALATTVAIPGTARALGGRAASAVDQRLQGDAAELDGPTDQTGENLRNEPQKSAAGAPSEEAGSSEIQAGSELEADEIQPATAPDAELAAEPNQAKLAQAGADVPADTAPAVEAPEATDAPATPQAPQEPPRAIRVPAEQAGQLPASMRVSRPQDPLMPDEGGEAEVPIGDELRGRLEDPPEPLPGEPVNKPQIISAMAKAVEAAGGQTPFKTGKVMKGALGFYRPHTDVIRVKTANDLTTAAHEMGHALDRHIFGKIGAVAKQVGPAEKRELLRIGRELYGDTRPTGGYRSEGFAEWMNWWATDPKRAREKAPKFTSWFEDTFLPANEGVAAELAKVRDYTTRWRGQGSAERVRQSIVDPASPSARAKRTTSGLGEKFVRSMVEEGWPLRNLSKAAEAQGAKLRPSSDPYKVFSALRMTHSAVVDQMVNQGMRDFAGNQVGPSLAEIRPLIKGRYADFRDYLIARRARALLTDPQGPRNPGITLEDAETVVEKYDSPEFQRAAAKLYEWNEGVLSYAAQSSPSFAKVVEAIRERDPGDYVPLFREIDDAARQFLGSGRKGGTPAKRLRGSGRRIKDPIQGVLASADAWVKAAHKRAVLDAILDVSKLPGMGHIIEKVPKDQVPVATRTLEDMIEQVQAEAAKAGGKVEVTAENVDLASEVLTVFAHSQMPKGSENIVPIINDKGTVEWYEVQPDLYKALSGLDVYRLPGFAEVLSVPAQLARMGHTGMRASFALITNPIRDAFTLYQNSRADGSGAALFGAWARNMLSGLASATGAKSGMTDAHKLFMRLGGEMAMPLGQDMAHTRRAARRLSQSKTVHTLDPRNAFDTLRDILQFPEVAPRVAELERVAKDMGIDLSQPITVDQAIELMIAGKTVTTDFTAAGSFARVLNRMTPFHNAAIQSPRASWRAFQRNPARYIARSLVSLTVPTLLLWYQVRDEEWWKDLPAREKYSYWHIPVDMPGHEGERIRIPRPYETGALFAAMPEMFLDSWYNEDPDAALEWVEHLFRVSSPPIVPLVAQETLEQVGNRDSYFGTPIVPMREERKPAEEQYDEFTTRAARHLGDLFGVSPRRIDHAMRSTLGGVSTDLLAATNLLPEPLKLGPEGDSSEWEMADTPVLGRLFARGGEFGTRSKNVDKLFEALDEAQTLQASDRHEETRKERELRLQLSDAAKAVTNLYAVRRLTPDKEKRRALTVEIAGIAREAMELHREETVRRSKMQLERKRAERLKERAERRATRREGQGK